MRGAAGVGVCSVVTGAGDGAAGAGCAGAVPPGASDELSNGVTLEPLDGVSSALLHAASRSAEPSGSAREGWCEVMFNLVYPWK